MDPAYFVLGVGLLSIYAGFYVRQNPDGQWNRLSASHMETWRDSDARQETRRGTPVVGGLLIVVGVSLILVAAVDLVSGLLGI